MILDHIWTQFLGGDLYARATYTRVYTVYVNVQKINLLITNYTIVKKLHDAYIVCHVSDS